MGSLEPTLPANDDRRNHCSTIYGTGTFFQLDTLNWLLRHAYIAASRTDSFSLRKNLSLIDYFNTYVSPQEHQLPCGEQRPEDRTTEGPPGRSTSAILRRCQSVLKSFPFEGYGTLSPPLPGEPPAERVFLRLPYPLDVPVKALAYVDRQFLPGVVDRHGRPVLFPPCPVTEPQQSALWLEQVRCALRGDVALKVSPSSSLVQPVDQVEEKSARFSHTDHYVTSAADDVHPVVTFAEDVPPGTLIGGPVGGEFRLLPAVVEQLKNNRCVLPDQWRRWVEEDRVSRQRFVERTLCLDAYCRSLKADCTTADGAREASAGHQLSAAHWAQCLDQPRNPVADDYRNAATAAQESPLDDNVKSQLSYVHLAAPNDFPFGSIDCSVVRNELSFVRPGFIHGNCIAVTVLVFGIPYVFLVAAYGALKGTACALANTDAIPLLSSSARTNIRWPVPFLTYTEKPNRPSRSSSYYPLSRRDHEIQRAVSLWCGKAYVTVTLFPYLRTIFNTFSRKNEDAFLPFPCALLMRMVTQVAVMIYSCQKAELHASGIPHSELAAQTRILLRTAYSIALLHNNCPSDLQRLWGICGKKMGAVWSNARNCMVAVPKGLPESSPLSPLETSIRSRAFRESYTQTLIELWGVGLPESPSPAVSTTQQYNGGCCSLLDTSSGDAAEASRNDQALKS